MTILINQQKDGLALEDLEFKKILLEVQNIFPKVPETTLTFVTVAILTTYFMI